MKNAGFLLVTTIAVIGTAALSTTQPTLAIAAIAAVFLAAVSMTRPKIFAGVALVGIVSSATLESKISGVGIADEAVVLIAVLAFSAKRLLSHGRLVGLPGGKWFTVFVVFGIVSSVFRDVPLGISAAGILLATKALLFAFALAQLNWSVSDFRQWVKYGSIGACVILACGLVNLAAPGPWSRFVLGYTFIDRTYVVPVLIGPFVHPAAFGRMCAIIAVAVVSYRIVIGTSRFSAALMVAAGGMSILSFRVKSLISMVAALGFLRFRYLNAGAVVAAFVALPAVVLIAGSSVFSFINKDLQAYVFDTSSARSTMTLGSFDVANGYFPLGAGFGRYGSFTAADNYSPEYVQRGFESVYGLSSGANNSNFLTDTQWPAIIGEAGWFGAACFAIGLARVASTLLKKSDEEDKHTEWIRLMGIGWLVLFLVESVAAPVFTSSPGYAFAFSLVGVIAAVRAARDAPSEPVRRRGSRTYAARSRY